MEEDTGGQVITSSTALEQRAAPGRRAWSKSLGVLIIPTPYLLPSEGLNAPGQEAGSGDLLCTITLHTLETCRVGAHT